MEKFIPTIIGIVLILCGVLELYLTYRYSKNIKKLKNQPPTAPFAIWSGLIFGLFFIVGPIIAMAGGLKNMNQMVSIVGGILFWIAAIFSLARAEKIRKKLKVENKPLSSSPQTVATYVIVIAAAISGLIAIF
jgi:hypothetical protein